MDDLTPMLHGLQRHGSRVAMWHEAGHAVVAMHYGVKVKYYGLDPLPHCLVSQRKLTKHQKGVLMCAGAAMTKAVFGFEWGGEASDYPMARSLGDLSVFKAEADELVKSLLPQAKYLVEARLGKYEDDPRLNTYGREFMGDDPAAEVPELTTDMPLYAQCVEAGDKAVLGPKMKKFVAKYAQLQMANPKLFSALAKALAA